ncbi:MAG: PIG-L family deacetylase [Verrucomicrobia bacterium]|nr:PIG-L family deacetylase [Verrucomicrobiota bacterium]MDE3099530.1 PIG-L family deacetylase [Verrucomicrobiota bacterium]
MKFQNPFAEIFVPDGIPAARALQRVTHLGIGAHQDDLEFMAFHGIAECYAAKTKWFGGVTCANGSGSARKGKFKDFSGAQITAIRRREQNAAAKIGRYGVMIQLNHPSSAVKNPRDASLKNDLREILAATAPEIVYTHNPADKHETHTAVCAAALRAIRELPRPRRPQRVIGCEVWRDLDWLPDEDKIAMDVTGREQLAARLNNVFKSQIAGGKRYDLAVAGRRFANATFFNPRATDVSTQIIFGMDLTPLAANETADIADFVCGFIDKFKRDVRRRLSKRPGK